MNKNHDCYRKIKDHVLFSYRQINSNQKTKKFQQLNYEKRKLLQKWLYNSIPKTMIANLLGMSRTALYKEIKKGLQYKYYSDMLLTPKYNAIHSEEETILKAESKGMGPKITTSILAVIQELVDDKCSPKVISYILNNDYNYCISFNTIYNYFKTGIVNLKNKK